MHSGRTTLVFRFCSGSPSTGGWLRQFRESCLNHRQHCSLFHSCIFTSCLLPYQYTNPSFGESKSQTQLTLKSTSIMSLIRDLLKTLLSYFHRQYRLAKASHAAYERLKDPSCVLPLEKLPTEITLMIVSHLDPVSQVCLKKACRHFWPNIHVPNRELSTLERALIRSFIMHDESISMCDRMDRRISELLLLDLEDGVNTRNQYGSRQPRARPRTRSPRRISNCSRATCYIDIRLMEIELGQREVETQLRAQTRRLRLVSTYMAASTPAWG